MYAFNLTYVVHCWMVHKQVLHIDISKQITNVSYVFRSPIKSCALVFCSDAGKYLEIFGRKNNLHNYWVTVGNEVILQVVYADSLQLWFDKCIIRGNPECSAHLLTFLLACGR